MRVERVSFNMDGNAQDIMLASVGSDDQRNHFTVINGVNGTGKSAVLRLISDAALGLENSRQGRLFVRDVKIPMTGVVSRTIALSGTHNDRFPVNSGIEIRLKSNQFDVLQFYYYGTKQSGVYTSVKKAASTISHSLLSEVNNPYLPNDSLVRLMNYLGFSPEVNIEVGVGSRTGPARTSGYEDYFEKLWIHLEKLSYNADRPLKVSPSLYHSIQLASNISRDPNFARLLKRPSYGKNITFDLRYGRSVLALFNEPLFDFVGADPHTTRPQLLADLISLGVIGTEVSLIRKRTREVVPLHELSSGEWHLLFTLLNLAIVVEDNSLILIDEPENSLHPQWQSDYVSLVRDLVSHRKGCHIIIATHSPLVSASVLPEDGNLVRFVREDGDGELRVEMEDTAYGWLPEDVLKERFDMGSVRPPELTEATNDALKILRKSSEQTPDLVAAANRIQKFIGLLPAHDPLLSVLRAIVEIATGPSGTDARVKDLDG